MRLNPCYKQKNLTFTRCYYTHSTHFIISFGAKLSVSLTTEGIANVGRISWEAFHESDDLLAQVEVYKQRYGQDPQHVWGTSFMALDRTGIT